MRSLFLLFTLSVSLFFSACDAENRHKEPGKVRNDTIYDMQQMVNEHARVDSEKESSGPSEEGKSCIDSSKIDPNAICTAQYDPVCGCDEVTYSNACKAESAGVVKFTQGECK